MQHDYTEAVQGIHAARSSIHSRLQLTARELPRIHIGAFLMRTLQGRRN